MKFLSLDIWIYNLFYKYKFKDNFLIKCFYLTKLLFYFKNRSIYLFLKSKINLRNFKLTKNIIFNKQIKEALFSHENSKIFVVS